MSEYAKHIQTIEDMWRKRIELREEGYERMSEYIIWESDGIEVQGHRVTQYEKREEIVRCRDCAKWSFFDVEDGVRYGECAEFTAKVDSGCGHATRESGFCAWGERGGGYERSTVHVRR